MFVKIASWYDNNRVVSPRKSLCCTSHWYERIFLVLEPQIMTTTTLHIADPVVLGLNSVPLLYGKSNFGRGFYYSLADFDSVLIATDDV